MNPKTRNTVLAVVAGISAFGPILLDYIGDLPWKWVKPVGVGVGFLIALCRDPRMVAGLSAVLPAPKTDAVPTTADDSVTKPETPEAKRP